MLTVQDLEVRYGSVVAVQNVSLTVSEGEFVALVGHNGAGKSTTLNAIVGILSSSSGRILFEDRSIESMSPERIMRLGISLVPENRRIFARLTVGENLKIGTTSLADKRGAVGDIQAMVDRFPILGTYFDKPAGTLSGGEQQQLAIARALLARPSLLLLDEPSLGLSPILVDRVFETLAELHADGVTILLVEQVARRAVALADRTYVMRSGGRIVMQGTRDEMRSVDLERSYLGFVEASGSNEGVDQS